ncbi:ChbG/HpnK family deacetylase [bacterium]|nr:ChbG/HpnK family deacetylase [bacterium]
MKETVFKAAAVLCVLCIAVWVIPQTAGAQDIRVIVRGDDMGMTQGSLAGFEKAFNEGVLTSGAIIVPGPWFEGAAELCRKNPGWCTGVHLALVGEWRGYRWRPVLPYDKVSSIVDEDGFLYTSPDVLWAHKPKIEEIDAELRAQVALAKKKGINVQYVDTHYMELNDYPGLENVIKTIAKENNVPISSELGEGSPGSVYTVPVAQKKDAAVKMLQELKPGLWLWVCHIGIESPEQDALIHTQPDHIFTNGGVGAHRAAELGVLTSIEVKSMILAKGIKLVSYTDLWKEQKKR